MKFFLILLALLSLTLPSHANAFELNFTDNVIAEPKAVLMDEILLNDIMKLQSKLFIDQTRMVAGEFESKKKEKKSHLDSLRSKLGKGNFTRL